ncbi:MAG TPA: glycosyltransferase family 2 protein, partial [Chloroflexota bacterium]|nr:glycosyltransferase family 2 protein [Chloroflexota bacterium]
VPAAFPPASAIIAAYLPNEAATVVETVEAFLRQDYPGDYQVILAYNTPQDLPVEAVLREIAARDRRFIPLRVPGSSSKAQNINAALSLVHGAFVGIFDADHHPQPGSFARAWHWLANGNDVVQGHCVVRNGAESWLTRLVAVEFECIYAVSHPGRARMHNFGIFGGSNGYWKTDLLRQIRMRSFMLTEDIDSSMRATMAGYAITADPNLLSTELAPATPRALWNQRMRWAQGWFQVSLAHLWRCLRSPRLTGRQKLGVLQLLGWREIYPYLANQMFPLLAFCLVHPVKADRVHLLVPLFLLTTVVAVGVGPGQTLVAYLLAAPQVRRHRRWFVTYMIVSALFYTPFKNLIAQVAQVKEIMRERQWKVTPRALPAAAEQEAVA